MFRKYSVPYQPTVSVSPLAGDTRYRYGGYQPVSNTSRYQRYQPTLQQLGAERDDLSLQPSPLADLVAVVERAQ